jgi:AcrR family transcriptional regulator
MRQESLDKARAAPGGTAARILDAAEEVFAEVGFEGASTREVAKRAAVPFGAIHYHWGTKRQLWQAVFKRVAERLRDTLRGNLRREGAPGEAVDALTDAFVDVLAASRNATRLFCRSFLDDVDDPYVQATFLELNESGKLLSQRLGGEMDPDVDILILSRALVAVLASEQAQRDVLGGDVFSSAEVLDRIRRELRAVARGLFRVSIG